MWDLAKQDYWTSHSCANKAAASGGGEQGTQCVLWELQRIQNISNIASAHLCGTCADPNEHIRPVIEGQDPEGIPPGLFVRVSLRASHAAVLVGSGFLFPVLQVKALMVQSS